ncbi:hypothetical protein [Escherichia coli]|uniref:hypothetical protein n=1 Tax=Escherichia coli TaxID=562 RepID=UPI0002A24314|nr:hypothetical protein [Escherichia coli]ELC54764.1 hypothetical protein WGI_05096 [Escherichia coli KTE44]
MNANFTGHMASVTNEGYFIGFYKNGDLIAMATPYFDTEEEAQAWFDEHKK